MINNIPEDNSDLINIYKEINERLAKDDVKQDSEYDQFVIGLFNEIGKDKTLKNHKEVRKFTYLVIAHLDKRSLFSKLFLHRNTIKKIRALAGLAHQK